MPGDSLKFGDVIRFKFAGADITAMVLTGHVDHFVLTDEGTSMSPADVGTTYVVFGLENTSEDENQYHQVGQTATFDIAPGARDDDGYEILT